MGAGGGTVPPAIGQRSPEASAERWRERWRRNRRAWRANQRNLVRACSHHGGFWKVSAPATTVALPTC